MPIFPKLALMADRKYITPLSGQIYSPGIGNSDYPRAKKNRLLFFLRCCKPDSTNPHGLPPIGVPMTLCVSHLHKVRNAQKHLSPLFPPKKQGRVPVFTAKIGRTKAASTMKYFMHDPL